MLKKIYKLLSKENKIKFFILVFAMTISAVVEILGVASIIPFMALISDTASYNTGIMVAITKKLIGLDLTKLDIPLLGVLTISIIIFSLIIRALTMYFILNFTQSQIGDLSNRLYKKYLDMEYEFFLQNKAEEIGNSTLIESERVVNTGITPVMLIITHSIASTGIFLFLLFLNFKITLASGIVLSILFGTTYLVIRRSLHEAGKTRLSENEKRYGVVQNSFLSIKTIKFEAVESYFSKIFENHTKAYTKALAKSVILSHLPRYFIEGITISGVIIISIIIVEQKGSFAAASPILAATALSGVRLLPSLQQIFFNYSVLRSADVSVNKIYEKLAENDISQPTPSERENTISLNNSKISKLNSLRVDNVSYCYPLNPKKTLFKINMLIRDNQNIGIVGSSGAGKTTLINLILGLLRPTEGSIFLNENNKLQIFSNKEWRPLLSYVPQNINIIPGTVAENIAFGSEQEQINMSRMINSAKAAEIYKFIKEELEDDFQTKIGLGNLDLSGGQLQRIGIARALYKKSSLLVMDEFTSALDSITERKILKNISKINYSIGKIFITHRIETLKNVSKIFVLEGGKIVDSGNFSDLEKRNLLFSSVQKEKSHD